MLLLPPENDHGQLGDVAVGVVVAVCVVAQFCMNTIHPGGKRADNLTACAV